MKEALQPGIMEVQLWALLNYANLANNEDWQDGRMLASGPGSIPGIRKPPCGKSNRETWLVLIPT